MSRLLLSLAIGGSLFYLIGNHFGLFTGTEGPVQPNPASEESEAGKAEVQFGEMLFQLRKDVPSKFPVVKTKRDPVVFTAIMNPIDKQEVFSPIPGKLLFIGVEVPEGAAQAAGVASFVAAPYENNSILGIKEDKIFIYRRLYENEIVENGELVGKMDVTRVKSELDLRLGKLEAADAMVRAAKAAADEAAAREITAKLLHAKGVMPTEEYRAAVLTKVKFGEEHKTKVEEFKLAGIEYEQTLILLRQHDLRNTLGVNRARIVKIFKARGEAVKEQDPIMLLENPDRLLAEGSLEASHQGRIREGDRVRVEPVEEQVPLRTLKGHLGEINAVAALPAVDSKEGDGYFWFLSASEDGTVCIWDRYARRPLYELVHGEPVRAMAVSKDNLLLTGTSEGNLFLWDLNRPGDPHIKEIKRAHRDAVTALAFSPDGAYFASGGADTLIQLYRTKKGSDAEILYPFDPDHGATDPHRGTITSLNLTHFGLLISASRDNTARIWEPREKGVRLKVKPLAGRTGGVGQLGVSRDGEFMFLDRGKDLQILSALNGTRFATMQNPPGGMPFETLALISPDNSLILTGGAPEGRLQLWRAPTAGSRGFEVRQLVMPERGTVTCAAFAPLTKKGPAMAVSGNKEGYVYLWTLPSPTEVAEHATEGVVQPLSATVDAGSRQVPIRVEVSNVPTAEHPHGRFSSGRPVTIVIED